MHAANNPPDTDLRAEFTRFMMSYKFAIDEVMTKINILREEFNHVHDYNPIEHVNSRLKSPESILEKAQRKGLAIDTAVIRECIHDIAGIRITCSFLSDIYKIREMLARQVDLTVIAERDYVASPKANGYTSLHLIVSIPVFMSDRVEQVPVEIQIRTIAMDFWASLEHKIYYKYNREVPATLLDELKEAADTANRLDRTMQSLHTQVRELDASADAAAASDEGVVPFGDLERLIVPKALLDSLAAQPPQPTSDEASDA
ncbi:GTP pyrophosphokinase [Agreia pratensis]|uniref:Putative GTP pyrophosphokinase n=1 Tax=Agreia pratensis TaxID=150121 RepID=A0A1X7IVI2_9MICO|nr:putative GTP pyrophosphokinase [Agreia pratensis]